MYAPPVVCYNVDGVSYENQLKYSYVSETTTFLRRGEIPPVDVKAEALKIRNGAKVPMKATFSIGSAVPVFYDRDQPKRSFVLRYAKSPLGWIFILMGIGLCFLGVIIIA